MKTLEKIAKKVIFTKGENIDDFSLLEGDETDQDIEGILNDGRITAEGEYQQAEPVVFLGGAAYAAKNNISTLSGGTGLGKTAIVSAIIAGAFAGNNFDGIEGIYTLPANGGAVIGIDTEQAESDRQYQLKTELKRCGLEKTPESLLIYNHREKSTSEKVKATKAIFEAAVSKFGRIHLAIIDGGADYLKSVNDEEASSELVLLLMTLANRYCCPIIVVIHTNPGGDKERGHFGSDLQRKSYGLATVTREKEDSDISVLKPKKFRKAGLGDAPPIFFKYDYERGYHMATEDPKSNVVRVRKKNTALAILVHSIFEGAEVLRSGKIIDEIQIRTGVALTTAKERMAQMAEAGLIEKTGPGKHDPYRLITEWSEMVGNGQSDHS